MAGVSQPRAVQAPRFSPSSLALLAVPAPQALRSAARKSTETQHPGQKAREISSTKPWLLPLDPAGQTGCSQDILPDFSRSLRPRGHRQSDPLVGGQLLNPKDRGGDPAAALCQDPPPEHAPRCCVARCLLLRRFFSPPQAVAVPLSLQKPPGSAREERGWTAPTPSRCSC